MRTKLGYYIMNAPEGFYWSGSIVVEWTAKLIPAREIQYDVVGFDNHIILHAPDGETKSLDVSDYHVSINTFERSVCQPESVEIDMKNKTMLVEFMEV